VPNRTVLTRRSEGVDILGETDIVNGLVMGYELCLDALLVDIPNGTGGVYRGRSNH
jgi:hypothetical protein